VWVCCVSGGVVWVCCGACGSALWARGAVWVCCVGARRCVGLLYGRAVLCGSAVWVLAWMLAWIHLSLSPISLCLLSPIHLSLSLAISYPSLLSLAISVDPSLSLSLYLGSAPLEGRDTGADAGVDAGLDVSFSVLMMRLSSCQ
jgi:hypothetical protein